MLLPIPQSPQIDTGGDPVMDPAALPDPADTGGMLEVLGGGIEVAAAALIAAAKAVYYFFTSR